MSPPNIANIENDLTNALHQRADYIPIDALLEGTAQEGTLFKKVIRELTKNGLRTIVGPRGCGKTHLMRFAWLTCRDTLTKPFAIFASFQRYFRLEPLQSSDVRATQHFHSWVLARILISAHDSCNSWKPKISGSAEVLASYGYPLQKLQDLNAKLERGQTLENELSSFSDTLSIESTRSIIDAIREKSQRRITVLLLDDAAMTLTPEYLVEFLDIVRMLQSADLAPKISVYPGTTEMSPRFHEGQDTRTTQVWISVEDAEYTSVMDQIASVRISNFDDISDQVRTLLRFVAFGIPRAYIGMIEEFQRAEGRTEQQKVMKIVNDHVTARIGEFRTLGKKIPKLSILVASGEKFIHCLAKELKAYNAESALPRRTRSLTFGLGTDERVELLDRMFKLLSEAGLIFYDGDVKHGTPTRIYHKYIPHTGTLVSAGALTPENSAGSLKNICETLALRPAKHPLRKGLSSIVGNDFVSKLDLALPECTKCKVKRLTDDQRFCHKCGNQLVDASDFNRCLETPIIDVPGLTEWQRRRIDEKLPKFRTIRDYLGNQDPTAQLLTVSGFGKKRSAKIADVLRSYVDDFLS